MEATNEETDTVCDNDRFGLATGQQNVSEQILPCVTSCPPNLQRLLHLINDHFLICNDNVFNSKDYYHLKEKKTQSKCMCRLGDDDIESPFKNFLDTF